jgi:D-serine deaminase-like pyridoxal phosphate-dependent protein
MKGRAAVRRLSDVPTPALVLDADRLETNLEDMANRASTLGVSLRPHIKTHKCIEIAERQRALGARGITVATLYEARVFADHGFDDITWAFPVILNRIPEIIELAGRVRLGLVVDTMQTVARLEGTGAPLHVGLKVDCGYHRAGVDPQGEEALDIARAIADSGQLRFEGILSHSGHAYDVASSDEAAGIAEAERTVMVAFAERLRGQGIEVPTVSVGSTPSMRAVSNLEGVTEVRPGNYALFDFTQVTLGSCTPADCAVTVLASVVSSTAGADHCLIDAGALALSKDPGSGAPHATMGEVFRDHARAELDPDLRVVAVSQEHGRMNARLAPGQLVRVLPNHSCLTVAQFDEMWVARGDDIVDQWKIWRGRD